MVPFFYVSTRPLSGLPAGCPSPARPWGSPGGWKGKETLHAPHRPPSATGDPRGACHRQSLPVSPGALHPASVPRLWPAGHCHCSAWSRACGPRQAPAPEGPGCAAFGSDVVPDSKASPPCARRGAALRRGTCHRPCGPLPMPLRWPQVLLQTLPSGPNRGLHPRPRPLCPTRGEQPMSGGEAEGIPGQEETGAAAAPELLPRIPDVALSTCPVLWGQAASPVLTAGPRGGPLRLQVAHQRRGSAPGRGDGWHSCSPSPAPGHHGSQQGPPGPGPVSVTGWCGLAEGMSPAGLAPGPGEIRHLSQEHKGGSQGRGTAACQACAGPLWPIISEVPAAPCQVGLLPLNR